MARSVRKRRMVDTWKTKKWYNVLAPKMFEEVKIGETIVSSPEDLIGRTIEVSMKDIAGDFTRQHIKLKFQIVDVRGENAHTIFRGQRLSREYLRSQIRRKNTKVEGIVDVITKDSHKIRVKVIALGYGRAQTSQEKRIRALLMDMVKAFAQDKSLDGFVRDSVNGKIPSEIYRSANKVYPLKRVEIRKIKYISAVKHAVNEELATVEA